MSASAVTRATAAVLAAAACAVLALPGSAHGSAGHPLGGLLVHLPAGAREVQAADLTLARAALGLPPTEPSGPRGAITEPGRRGTLLSVTQLAFLDVAAPATTPLEDALVQGDVSAVIGTFDGPTVTIIATRQSRPSLTASLRRAGFSRAGDGAWSATPRGRPTDAVALFPGGLVETDGFGAAADRREVATLASRHTLPPSDDLVAAQLAAAGPAPSAGTEIEPRGCVAAVTITDDLVPALGSERLLARGAAGAVHVSPGAGGVDAAIGAPTVSGSTLVAPLSLGSPMNPYPLTILDGLAHELWTCG